LDKVGDQQATNRNAHIDLGIHVTQIIPMNGCWGSDFFGVQAGSREGYAAEISGLYWHNVRKAKSSDVMFSTSKLNSISIHHYALIQK
jgi:hypothetical protein